MNYATPALPSDMSQLFDITEFVPRATCGNWSDLLVVLSQSANLLIAVSYTIISMGILVWLMMRWQTFAAMQRLLMALFVAFILTCGGTHLCQFTAFSWPAYRLFVGVELLCALTSVPTAVLFCLPRTHRWFFYEMYKQSEGRLAAILDSAFSAFVATDERGVIIRWNLAAERVFGWKKEEVLGCKNVLELIPQKLRGDYERGLHTFLHTGYGPILNRTIEQVGLHKDGHEFPVELSVSPLRYENEWRFNAFIMDISHRKRNLEHQSALKEAVEAELRRLQAQPSPVVAKGAAMDVVNKLKALVNRP